MKGYQPEKDDAGKPPMSLQVQILKEMLVGTEGQEIIEITNGLWAARERLKDEYSSMEWQELHNIVKQKYEKIKKEYATILLTGGDDEL